MVSLLGQNGNLVNCMSLSAALIVPPQDLMTGPLAVSLEFSKGAEPPVPATVLR